MNTAKLFTSGHSQVVRLPREFQLPGKEVLVKHFGGGVLLLPLNDPWQLMQDALEEFEPGFQISRDQPAQLERAGWSE